MDDDTPILQFLIQTKLPRRARKAIATANECEYHKFNIHTVGDLRNCQNEWPWFYGVGKKTIEAMRKELFTESQGTQNEPMDVSFFGGDLMWL